MKIYRGGIVKPCVRCRVFFEATNNRQKYCGNQRERTGCAWLQVKSYKHSEEAKKKENARKREKRAMARAIREALNPKVTKVKKTLRYNQFTKSNHEENIKRASMPLPNEQPTHVPVRWTPWFMEKAQ